MFFNKNGEKKQKIYCNELTFIFTIIFYHSYTQPFFINFSKGKRSYSISVQGTSSKAKFFQQSVYQ